MILEKTSYNLKDEFKEELSQSLTQILDSEKIISGFSIENNDNEQYTSRDFLDRVKESYRLKKTTFLTSNLNSNFRSTKSLSLDIREKFLNVTTDFAVKHTEFKKELSTITGCMIYPKNGYMGWHNNSRVGWRLYCTYCVEQAKSYFRYEDDNGNFIDSNENKGWNFRLFFVRDNLSPLWHSVYTESERIAIGTYIGRDFSKIQNIIGDKK
tara:strand:+ start:310 stop:942 length:633 start_codon:yes stop_codon:yes gene_type:complete